MVTKTFGEMLYSTDQTGNLEQFPSPESLKKKVLISTKPPKEYLERHTQGVQVSEKESGTVRKCAFFIKNDFPHIVKEGFGKILLNCGETENTEQFPSPESLKEKVLIL